MYEPCRQRTRRLKASYAGRLWGAPCARLVLDALSCRLSQPQFAQLRADRNAFSHSAAGRQLGGISSAASAYVSWVTRCWRTHAAAKVVRLQSLADVRALAPHASPPQLRVLLLLRPPAEVVASRLTLRAFTDASPFNPRGTPSGVVETVCRAMNTTLAEAAAAAAAAAAATVGAATTAPAVAPASTATATTATATARTATAAAAATAPQLSTRTLRFDALLAAPRPRLVELYTWLGLGRSVPQPVRAALGRCGLRDGVGGGGGGGGRGGGGLTTPQSSSRPRRRLSAAEQTDLSSSSDEESSVGQRRYRVCGNRADFRRGRGGGGKAGRGAKAESVEVASSDLVIGEGGRRNLSEALHGQLARECADVLRWFAENSLPAAGQPPKTSAGLAAGGRGGGRRGGRTRERRGGGRKRRSGAGARQQSAVH